MDIPEDTHLAYIVCREAWWYAASASPGELPSLMIQASAKGTGGGVAWEFQITEEVIGGKMSTHVLMFDDAYAAFAQFPEFFAALAEHQPGTLMDVRAMLDGFGAADETDRVSPYASTAP